MTPSNAFRSSVAELADLLKRCDSLTPAVEAMGNLMMASWNAGGKTLFAGNGGSAADAMHFAEELVVRYRRNRRALAAIALCDPTAITCAGNDMGFENIFSRQIDALAKPEDVFVAITTSGNSPNILAACEVARARGTKIVGLLGRGGGALKGRCDVEIIVPSDNTARIQEVHKLLFHSLCDWIDEVV